MIHSRQIHITAAFLFLLNYYCQYASAQDAGSKHIQGKITDAGNKQPLEGTTIETIPPFTSATTDEQGSFELTVDSTVKKIVVQYPGYATDTIGFDLNNNKPVLIALQPATTIKEVVVNKRKKSTEMSMLNTHNMQTICGRELAKAACCNLSESFETTPSVDVGFTDAVSGYKQISMLGLAGANTLFTRENIPDIRGLASITGLSLTPGAWVENMQLSKGSGSVVNGFEGAAGQINVEWLKPFEEEAPRLLINGYQSTQGRSEGNVVINHQFNEKLSTSLLLHGRGDWMRVDQNNDGFMDQPLGSAFIGSNRWFYFSPNGLEIQGGVKGVYLNNTGGQKDYEKGENATPGNPWGYESSINRLEAWAKIGKVYAGHPGRSMGMQLSGVYHDQESEFGQRDYSGAQRSLYANYIYQDILGTSDHIIKGGASFLMDNYNETFVANNFKRTETVPGVFVEYTYNYLTKFNIVAGLRADYHNIYGAFFTPRLHLRYAPYDKTVFRASVGRSQRTTNVFADNLGLMASGRQFIFPQNAESDKNPYGLKPEVAWNMGVNFTQKFMLNYRDGAFSVDYYYTDFTNQAIVDMETPGYLSFYNLDGKSYAHSLQAQLDYEPLRNFDVRLAYRFYDVKSTYGGVLKEKPLIAANRAFANLAYETKNNWKFDYTLQWIGAKRLPARYYDAGSLHQEDHSQPFITMNAQISKSWKDGLIEVYAGGENLTGFMQHHMILGLDNPYGQYFDASLIWGPGMGRNFYLGFRYKLK